MCDTNTKLHVQMFFRINPKALTFLVNEKSKELFFYFLLRLKKTFNKCNFSVFQVDFRAIHLSLMKFAKNCVVI